jgi:hypothetical protein
MADQGDSGDDPHLRSLRSVLGYGVRAADGEIGHVEDLISETKTWVIRYLAVNTRNWLPGKKVLISPHWTDRIGWEEKRFHVDLSQDQIKNSPAYDPAEAVNRDYENHLFDFYGRSKYWPEDARKE